MPPWRAMAMAILASVTVSIAADSSGMLQHDVAGQPRAGVDLARDDVGFGRQQQDIVEGQTEHARTSAAWPRRTARASSRSPIRASWAS